MQSKKNCVLAISVAAGLLGVGAASANAAIMDQIGTSPALITSQSAYASDVFDSAHATDDVAVVDDFTVTGPTLLTKVFAVTDGYDGFVSYSDVTAWGVEIYSSLAAADSSLTGDVYSHTFAPASVNLTTPFGGNSSSGLFNVSTLAVLPSGGTYYLAVIAANSFTANGVVGIYATTGVTNSTPGGLNAYQVNPPGGFGFAGNENPLHLDAAYAVVGVAVPEPVSATGLVIAGSVLSLSRRRRAR